jgi:hypothetical protein
MSLSPFDSFQSRFVTYLLNRPHIMHKKMQKLVARNIRDESLWYFLYNNLPTNQGSPQKPQCTMRLHIYRKQWKNENNIEPS